MCYTPAEEQCGETSTSPCPLCSTMGARGVSVLQGVREGVLEASIDEEVGLWTQTLLARDELDGWSGLRPFDLTSSGLFTQASGHPSRMKHGPHHHLCTKTNISMKMNSRVEEVKMTVSYTAVTRTMQRLQKADFNFTSLLAGQGKMHVEKTAVDKLSPNHMKTE